MEQKVHVDPQLLRAAVQQLLTLPEVARRFRRTQMTIWTWRNKKGLPCVTMPVPDGAHAVRFIESEMEQWAREHGKQFYRD